ncbi:MAG: AbrB family transcriptional regulator [Deltaproteobacteria bacterium HGW-Deltaproteobacteria-22]|jgi:AbrB family looped-hinge helix DNA binding protein|nr:MAG: AbrB family transcriptional regulator [Deltaproteobacteria bacterium HGW-Deltaproteobacteria-22]
MTVTVSPKYQVVIPQEVREVLQILPGMKVQVFVFENRIEIIPEKPMRDMRGFLRGLPTDVEREEDRP